MSSVLKIWHDRIRQLYATGDVYIQIKRLLDLKRYRLRNLSPEVN